MKWMRSGRGRGAILGMLLVVLLLNACQKGMAGRPTETGGRGLDAVLEALDPLSEGQTVRVRFTLTNNTSDDLYLLQWYTPFEGIYGEIFVVERDGQPVPYEGILAMRGDPTPEDYFSLAAGESASTVVDLAGVYDFSQPGRYTIAFLSPRISHVAHSEAEMADSVEDLGPVAISSNSVVVTVPEPAAASPSPRLGYIGDLYEQGGAWYISFDAVEWLTDTKAAEAMVEDGECSGSVAECWPPNGFYIRNREQQRTVYPLAERIVIVMQTLSHGADGNFQGDERISLDRFRRVWYEAATLRLREVPYEITFEGQVVVMIRERYVP